ncbi:MAG: SDR family NAD(P)-dependent oxidoreductase [Nitriliruptorales bacterium]
MANEKALAGSVVVITGASSGIGKAAALAFAAEGANVVLAARRLAALEVTAQECRNLGVAAVAVAADTTDPRDVERIATRALDEFGHFDVWINNASCLMFGSLEQTPADAYTRLVEVNLFGYVNGARCALSHFRERGRGVLINNASLFSIMPTGYTNAYTTTKHGVEGFSDALRQELVPSQDIHVVKILPAGVDTPILQHAANYSGRTIRPLYPLVSAQRVAKVMVRSALRPRRAVVVGRLGRLNAALYHSAPLLGGWVYGRMAAKALERADPSPETHGNVFEPVADGISTSGGLRGRSRRWWVVPVGALVALSAGELTRRWIRHARLGG